MTRAAYSRSFRRAARQSSFRRMRNLATPPARLFDPAGPRFGSYSGGLPRLDLGPTGHGRVWNFVHEKRWVYAAVADDDVFAAAAIVHLGYASTALAYALDRRTGRMLFDRSVMGPADAVTFSDGGAGKRSGTFRFGRARLSLGDEPVLVDFAGGELPFHVDTRACALVRPAPAIGAVVPIEGGF